MWPAVDCVLRFPWIRPCSANFELAATHDILLALQSDVLGLENIVELLRAKSGGFCVDHEAYLVVVRAQTIGNLLEVDAGNVSERSVI